MYRRKPFYICPRVECGRQWEMLILEIHSHWKLVSSAPILPAWPTLESVHLDEEHPGAKIEEANSATAEPEVGKGVTAGPGRLILSCHSHGLCLLIVVLLSVLIPCHSKVCMNPNIFNAVAKNCCPCGNSRVEPKEGHCFSVTWGRVRAAVSETIAISTGASTVRMGTAGPHRR